MVTGTLKISCRKWTVLLAMLLMSAASGYAQTTYAYHYGYTGYDESAFPYSNAKEVNLAYGQFATPQLGYLFQQKEWASKTNTGSVSFSVRKYIDKSFSYGFSIGWQSFSMNHSDVGSVQNPDYLAKFNVGTLAFEFKKRHIWGHRYQLYSLFGLGGSYIAESKGPAEGVKYYIPVKTSATSGFVPNGQLTPIGASYGNRLSAYAELGVGYKGILNIGACYVLPSHKNDFPHGPQKLPKQGKE